MAKVTARLECEVEDASKVKGVYGLASVVQDHINHQTLTMIMFTFIHFCRFFLLFQKRQLSN